MDSKQIEQYLAMLGEELQKQGVKQPIRLLLIGGAFIQSPRKTLGFSRRDIRGVPFKVAWVVGPKHLTCNQINIKMVA